MKKNILAAVAALVVLTGCTATQSTVTEYDKDGKVVKTTVTSESVISTLTKSTKDKTVIAWESGWAAYISASAATQEDPTPTVKLFAGKTDKGIISAHKDQKEWSNIAGVIKSTKYDLEVSATGVKSGNSAAVK
jgi:hypothetical protein